MFPPSKYFEHFPPYDSKSRWTQEQMLISELLSVKGFAQQADSGGSTLPEYTADGCAEISRWLNDDARKDAIRESTSLNHGELRWPPRVLESLFALAQHYGIPTRLLDWSRSPLIAAYFCIEGFISGKQIPNESTPRVGVWALNCNAVEVKGITDPLIAEGGSEKSLALRTVAVPTGENPNLEAQQGVFLVRRLLGFREDALVDLKPFEDSFQSLRSPGYEEFNASPIYRITLPALEAPRLLRLLSHVGVSAARLYPGYEGARRGYDELVWLDMVDSWKPR